MKFIISNLFVLFILTFSMNGQMLPGGDRAVIFEDEQRRKTLDSSLFLDISLKGFDYNKIIGAELGLSFGTMLSSYSSLGIIANYLLTHNVKIGSNGESLTLVHTGIIPEVYLPLYFIEGLYLNAGCQLGFGYADYTQITTFEVQKPKAGKWFLLAEPSIGLLQRVSKDIIIGFEFGRRFSNNFKLIDLTPEKFQGNFATLSFRVLMFRY